LAIFSNSATSARARGNARAARMRWASAGSAVLLFSTQISPLAFRKVSQKTFPLIAALPIPQGRLGRFSFFDLLL